MKKVIIIGASSGIGKELSKVFAQNGYMVGLAARRTNLLEQLGKSIGNNVYIKTMDVSKSYEAIAKLDELVEEMDGVDIIVICSGIGYINEELDLKKEIETIDVNVTGFTSMINCSVKHFLNTGEGTIVGVSSVAAIRGNFAAPAYNASKSYVSNYLEGIRSKVKRLKLNIKVIDIRPGLVDTNMAKGDKLFWMVSPEKAAIQIFQCIKKGKEVAYITKRWALIAWLLKWLPMK